MAQGENLSLQGSAHSEETSERQPQRKQDGHHCFGRLHGRARRFNGIKADGVFGRDNLDLEGDSIRDISFQGSGCAISKASASLMTQSVKGKTRAEADRVFDQFHKLVTGQSPANGNRAELGKLAVFSGVSEFPVRVKCATLAWHTLHAALQGKQQTVSTE